MPLKHASETVLLIILAVVTLVAGLYASALPDLPVGWLPWLAGLIITALYVLVFYPLFIQKRADYSLRSLHWLPAAILLFWLLFQLLAEFLPFLGGLKDVYSYAAALLPVTGAFMLLAYYSVKVIRWVGVRLLALTVLLVPYILFAFASEAGWFTPANLMPFISGETKITETEDEYDFFESESVLDKKINILGNNNNAVKASKEEYGEEVGKNEEERVMPKKSWWSGLLTILRRDKTADLVNADKTEPADEPVAKKWRPLVATRLQIPLKKEVSEKTELVADLNSQTAEDDKKAPDISDLNKKTIGTLPSAVVPMGGDDKQFRNVVDIARSGVSGRGQEQSSSAPALPHSGPGFEFLLMMVLAGYFTMLQVRVRKRQ